MPDSDTRDDAPTVRLQQRDLAAAAIPFPRSPEPDRPSPAPAARGASLAWVLLAVAAVVLAVAAAITAGLLSRQAAAEPAPPVPAALAAPSPAALPAAAPAAAAPTAPVPVLGATDGVTPGFGQARPTSLDYQGGISSSIRDISWQSWGGEQATGTGTAVYVAPDQQSAEGSEEQATIIATDLGTCDGTPAYGKVQWFFPQHGGSYKPATATDACS